MENRPPDILTHGEPNAALGEQTCPSCSAAGRSIGHAKNATVFQCHECELCFLSRSQRPQTVLDNAWYADLVAGPSTWAKEFVEEMQSPYGRQLETLGRLVHGKTLLDVGCGIGVFLQVARDRGWITQGIEESPHAIEYACVHYRLDLRRTLAEVPPASQDVVRISHVLEHVPEPRPFLRELGRVLKPGGVLYILVPNREPLCEAVVNRVRQWFTNQPRLAGAIYPHMHVLGFNPASLVRLVEGQGFSPVSVLTRSMGDATYYPFFYDGLLRRKRLREIPLGQWPRYYAPSLVNRLGDPFERGSWIIGYFRKR